MVKRLQILFLAVIGAMSAACAAATRPLIRTDRTEYFTVSDADGVSLAVIATMTNATADTLWLHPCAQRPPYPPVVALDRFDAGAWAPAWGPFCTRALMCDPPRLLPGASRVDTVRVHWSRRARTQPALPPWPIEGSFRLRYSYVYRSTPECRLERPVHDSLLTSDVFRISR